MLIFHNSFIVIDYYIDLVYKEVLSNENGNRLFMEFDL